MKLNFDWRDFIMGVQYLFVAAGATILVPILTGLPVSICLFSAGVGTIIFHLVTKGQVPVLLSSSFAFIAPIIVVSEVYGVPFALGGIMTAGIVYLLLATLIYFIGIEVILKLFPPVVTSTMVILIGLILAPVAIANASTNWLVAGVTFTVGALIKGFFDEHITGSLSVIIAIFIGSLVATPLGLGDLTGWSDTGWLSFPAFMLPKFSFAAIAIIAPIAIVTFLEHFADISAVGKVVEKDFLKEPGVHRTLLGDGLATAFAGLVGGCPNTTYSENIGALEMTGVKKPVTLQITAVLMILLAFLPKVVFLVQAIPAPVIGGISILLFGMIAANGVKGLANDKVDMKNFHNVVIVASMLVIGAGGTIITLLGIQFSSLAVAAIVGIVLNIIFNFRKMVQK